jgi:hypothetical protein
MRMPANVEPQITTSKSSAAQLSASPVRPGAGGRVVFAFPPAVSTQCSACDGDLLERILLKGKATTAREVKIFRPQTETAREPVPGRSWS